MREPMADNAAQPSQSAVADPQLADALADLAIEATQFIAGNRAETILRQWLSGAEILDGGDDDFRVATALALALDLLLAQPSAKGLTAFDRLGHARRLGPVETRALAALRVARYRLCHVDGFRDGGVVRLTDLATGETLEVFSDGLPPAALGCDIFGRFGRADGLWVAAGTMTPLDAAARAVAERFVAPNGRGLTNPLRCAEAVYRHVVRHGTTLIVGLNAPPELDADPCRLDPDDSEHDALAFHWAELDPSQSPPRGEVAQARTMIAPVQVLEVIDGAVIAQASGREALAEGYKRLLYVQLETLAQREAAGVIAVRLTQIRALLAESPRRDASEKLFDSMVARLPRAGSSRPRAEDSELERLLGRIRALRAKTVEQGCTEQEAMAAAEKVAELLDRYGLTLSELELRRQVCEGVGIDTGRRRAGPVDNCAPTIAAFFDCRGWLESQPDGSIRQIFFGLPGDVAAARYLYELVDRAFDTETAAFKASAIYAKTPTSGRRGATTSFQHGMTLGINAKLTELRAAREAALRSGSGRDLIPVKTSMIEDELDKLGLKFRATGGSGGRRVQRDAYAAGREAGQRFDYTPGIAQG